MEKISVDSLSLYNTLSRRKEVFRPIRKNWVGLYTCGPTVYNYVHIGNLRTYIFQDILKRALQYAGYEVKHIMNLTDVDDKTIKGARQAGKSLKEFTRHYEKLFKEDLKRLNIEFPDRLTRATEHVTSMIRMISALLERGFAYQREGSVYFDISEFKPYGKLAHLDLHGLKAGARVDADEYTKDAVQDFILWKKAKPGEPFWLSPFGRGRPGWHIECSAMSTQYLGQPFDLHSAAVDLIFPHHENEIAQSEGARGKKFVRYWMHGEHLLVNGEKMSKSLGNILTLHDVENKGFSPFAFRYLILTAHYRSKLNFTWKSLEAAQKSLERLYDFVRELKRRNLYSHYRGFASIVKKSFTKAIFNDLDTPKVLAAVWDLVRKHHKSPQRFNPKEMLNLLYDFDRVLGLGFRGIKKESVPERIKSLAQKREKYRRDKDWIKADELRKKILQAGFTIEDTPEGPRLQSSRN